MPNWSCPSCWSTQVVVVDRDGNTVAEDPQELANKITDGELQSTDKFVWRFLCLICEDWTPYYEHEPYWFTSAEERASDEWWQKVDYHYDRIHDR